MPRTGDGDGESDEEEDGDEDDEIVGVDWMDGGSADGGGLSQRGASFSKGSGYGVRRGERTGPHFFAARWTWKSDKHTKHRQMGGSADASKHTKPQAGGRKTKKTGGGNHVI
jgi:hypothetical protein